MEIKTIVAQALNDGYLTPVMEGEISRICETTTELSPDEYSALDELMSALLNGKVVASHRKKCINVMEELVLTEAITIVAEIEVTSDQSIDLSDITAYALNRLPPLYATTEEGANYQKQRAQNELQELINQRVQEAITHHLKSDKVLGARKALGKDTETEVAQQISSLLQTYAEEYEN
ncbi:Late competence development protein ComFB [Halothece sp. PCC 7418]|uniref:late competence development ComFB family protein n=1 Tax=Halothece sp. (strain PCC 7418) TaxID=65093 RepID=UPI0002A06380|nr:late competence development ComFB family protein [Halothece sp. PCC 7418]AFZ45625.1 Late competence development protein ComFB [Halothece sp. PCC 7418]